MLTRQQIIDLTGEDPVDVLGPDWMNEAIELGSNCCGADIIENTDYCKACKEHCGTMILS